MSEKITITFPDENSKEVEKGISGLAIAEQISESLAKEAIAFSVDDEINDLSRKVEKDSRIKILKRNDEEALSLIRHDLSLIHI